MPNRRKERYAQRSTVQYSEEANDTAKMTTDAPPSLPEDLQNLRTMLATDMKGIFLDLIENALSPVKESLASVELTTFDHGKRITELEGALSDYSDTIVALEKTCARLSSQTEDLASRAEDAENRSRRCNLRIINIPENTEGEDTVGFMSEFFAEVLGKDIYSTPPVLERAHRIGQSRPDSAGKPRVMIVRFHYYRDRARALGGDRNRLVWRGRKMAFFPDYATNTAKQRATFVRVKTLLYEKKVKFRLVYPALLKVDYGGKEHAFKTATEAQLFYDRHFPGASMVSEAT